MALKYIFQYFVCKTWQVALTNRWVGVTWCRHSLGHAECKFNLFETLCLSRVQNERMQHPLYSHSASEWVSEWVYERCYRWALFIVLVVTSVHLSAKQTIRWYIVFMHVAASAMSSVTPTHGTTGISSSGACEYYTSLRVSGWLGGWVGGWVGGWGRRLVRLRFTVKVDF